jgi:hypothetical protein
LTATQGIVWRDADATRHRLLAEGVRRQQKPRLVSLEEDLHG